eukprot:4902280-Amphidinium_carterae.1
MPVLLRSTLTAREFTGVPTSPAAVAHNWSHQHGLKHCLGHPPSSPGAPDKRVVQPWGSLKEVPNPFSRTHCSSGTLR